MRMMLLALLVGLPILAMWQGGPLIKRTNPSTLSTPTGYTHVVEVTGPGKTDLHRRTSGVRCEREGRRRR